jgi:hypothetical protein
MSPCVGTAVAVAVVWDRVCHKMLHNELKAKWICLLMLIGVSYLNLIKI